MAFATPKTVAYPQISCSILDVSELDPLAVCSRKDNAQAGRRLINATLVVKLCQTISHRACG